MSKNEGLIEFIDQLVNLTSTTHLPPPTPTTSTPSSALDLTTDRSHTPHTQRDTRPPVRVSRLELDTGQ